MARSPELRILSGNAHPQLAADIASELGTSLVAATIEQFPDEETSIKIDDDVREQDIFVVQPTGPPANHNVMESLLVIDALRRASADRITAVIPYFGYARQDRKDRSRVPISAKVVANLFASTGVDRLLAVDLHSQQIQGFSDLPFDHLYATGTIAKAVSEDVERPVVVAPDVGAAKMVRRYARLLQTEWAIFDKEREDAYSTKLTPIIGEDVNGRNTLIVDDMTSTGGTLVNAATALKEAGAVGVVAAVTHGVFSPRARDVLENSDALDALYTTDTLPPRLVSDKVRRITIAPLLAKAIANIHIGRSVSSLFE